jgi:hypothetical protein
MFDLNTLIDPEKPLPKGITLQLATDINDHGWIVANAFPDDDISFPPSIPYLLRPTRRVQD